jgi:hypothetical protein
VHGETIGLFNSFRSRETRLTVRGNRNSLAKELPDPNSGKRRDDYENLLGGFGNNNHNV